MIWHLLDKLIIFPSHLIAMIERVVWEKKIQGIIKKQAKDLHRGEKSVTVRVERDSRKATTRRGSR